jgi:hypothetical protein
MVGMMWFEQIETGTPQLPRHARAHPTPHYDCVACLPEHGNRLDERGQMRAHWRETKRIDRLSPQE